MIGRRRWGREERVGRGKGQQQHEGGIDGGSDASGVGGGAARSRGRGHATGVVVEGEGRGIRDNLNNSGHWI